MPLTRDQIIDIKSVFKSSFDDLLKDSNFIHRIAGEIIKTLEKNFDLALKKYEQRCELSENEKLLLNRIDDYEQYTRRNNVRIFGIPEDKGEDVQDKVLQLCKKKLNMNITTEYIDRCHRVGSKKDRSPIIVKFIRHDFKQNMLNNRRKLKNSKIFVAEDLTTKRYQFFTAICKKFGYKNVQTRDGNILIKIDAVLHKIRSANDFEKFKQIQGLSMIKVFKKSSPNNKLTLYLSSRDLVVSSGKIDRVQGVLLVDPEFVEQRKVYGQVTLTFRYGREDEEVMGLKFCNEAVMCLAQLYPPHAGSQPPEANTPLQAKPIKVESIVWRDAEDVWKAETATRISFDLI